MGRMRSFWMGALLGLPGAAALAGSLGVGPTLLELGGDRKVTVLTVRNTGTDTAIVQMEAVAWSQREGSDSYAPTNDLAATPEVFELKPGAEREVRVGLRDSATPRSERSYRLYAREVVTPSGSESQLQFAVRIGVPVFVTAPAKVAEPELSWELGRSDDGCTQLRLRNQSGTRTRVSRLELMSGEAVVWNHETPLYVLAGATRVVESPLCRTMPTATTLRVTSNARTLNLQPAR